MKNFDIKKIVHVATGNPFELSEHLIKTEVDLVNALHIFHSILENPDEKEYHDKKIKEFYEKFV